MLAATAWEAELSYKRANLDADSVSPKGAAEFRCRSAANPVLAHLISAVARVAQITFKKLISHRFLLITGKFWTRKRFFPLSTAELRRVRHRGGWGMRGSGSGPPGINSRPASNLAYRVSGSAHRGRRRRRRAGAPATGWSRCW